MNEANADDALLPKEENNILDQQKKQIESLKNMVKNRSNERRISNSNVSSDADSINKKVNIENEIFFAITFIGRLVMTLYSFHGLFFIYNFIIQYIILVPGILYEINSKFLQFLLGFIYIIFAICISNVLVIPTYEFLLFPYLNFKNPLYHLKSIIRVRYIIENKKEKLMESEDEIENKQSNYINGFLIIIEFLYILSYLLAMGSVTTTFKDVVIIIILIIIYTYYLMIFLGYAMISIYLCVKFLSFSKDKHKGEGFFSIIKNAFDLNAFFGDPEKEKDKTNPRDIGPLPKINLLCYVVNPLLKRSYKDRSDSIISDAIDKKHFEDYFYYCKSVSRIVLFLFSFILICFVINKRDGWAIIFFIIFFIFISFISIFMNFPVCFKNKKTFGYYWSEKIKYKKEYKMMHPSMVTFIRFICNVFVTLAALLLFFSFFYFKDTNKLQDLYDLPFASTKLATNVHSSLFPNMCFSSIHNINLQLYLPFINDAYYYNDNPEEGTSFSSFNIDEYRKLFFDDSYKIDNIRNLINNKNKEESVKMIQYNVKNDYDEVTILAIKGPSIKKDIFIDFQLYFPSILLNLLSTFSIQGQQKESISYKFVEFSLSIPYRLFFQYSVIDEYLADLTKAYNENYKTFYKNVVIVGHSLGGGLAKLLGRILNKQAISLSGPGINAFHTLWGYEGQSENFEISAIDLVPDMDIVPRVEISAGTAYRIICKSGIFGCHDKVLSLCEVLIMCRNPNYETYCKNIAKLSDKKINELYKSSKFN